MIFGGAFEPQGARAAFEIQKRKLVERGLVAESTLRSPVKTEACTLLRPRPGQGIVHGADRCFLIGEAAGLISPSSFEGISYALCSGEALADAFVHTDSPDTLLRLYRRTTQNLTRKIAMRHLKCPFMYHQVLRTALLKSGIGALHLKKGDLT